MTIRQLPKIEAARTDGINWDVRPDALKCWDANVRAEDGDDASISIYDVIGHDPWTGGGVTVKRIAAALRTIGRKDVVVNINSPGGDFFEGVAIYNSLREHKARVTVRVVGLAASAASIIAMAGDDIEIGAAAFMMVHNTWALAIGNRHDMRDVADTLEQFDQALVNVYSSRTGEAEADIAKMLDKETWMSGQEAIDKGFADKALPSEQIAEADASIADQRILAMRRIESALASQGISRNERRSLIGEIAGPAVADQSPAVAGIDCADLARLTATLRG